jgi:hypothetical protein
MCSTGRRDADVERLARQALVQSGLSTKEIAQQMGISTRSFSPSAGTAGARRRHRPLARLLIPVETPRRAAGTRIAPDSASTFRIR